LACALEAGCQAPMLGVRSIWFRLQARAVLASMWQARPAARSTRGRRVLTGLGRSAGWWADWTETRMQGCPAHVMQAGSGRRADTTLTSVRKASAYGCPSSTVTSGVARIAGNTCSGIHAGAEDRSARAAASHPAGGAGRPGPEPSGASRHLSGGHRYRAFGGRSEIEMNALAPAGV
jgi:hypothetical protein